MGSVTRIEQLVHRKCAGNTKDRSGYEQKEQQRHGAGSLLPNDRSRNEREQPERESTNEEGRVKEGWSSQKMRRNEKQCCVRQHDGAVSYGFRTGGLRGEITCPEPWVDDTEDRGSTYPESKENRSDSS